MNIPKSIDENDYNFHEEIANDIGTNLDLEGRDMDLRGVVGIILNMVKT